MLNNYYSDFIIFKQYVMCQSKINRKLNVILQHMFGNKIAFSFILKLICVTVFLSLNTWPSKAQKISTKDSIEKKPVLEKTINYDTVFAFNTKNPLPKRAALYSALFPGVGQVYNKQYWKLGLVTAGVGTITYFLVDNTKFFRSMKKNYLYRIDNNPATETDSTFENYETSDLRTILDGSRKNLETTYLAGIGGYMICILDAYISAHLKSFDMSKNLSLQLKPTYLQKQVGVAMCLKF
jgi:hypothetical protein